MGLQHGEIQNKLAMSLDILRCRILGMSYDFSQIAGEIDARMFEPEQVEILTAIRLYHNSGKYSITQIAFETGLNVQKLASDAQRHSDTDLRTAFDSFRFVYGQHIEQVIGENVHGWIAQGKDAAEMQSEGNKLRMEKGAATRVIGTDGKDDFEKELSASIEGKIIDYPVKPFLPSVQKILPCYEPGDYVVVGALSGVGKSYYAHNQLLYTASEGIPCQYINLEMQPKNVQKRLWQMQFGQKFERDFSQRPDHEMQRMLQVWEDVKKLPIQSVNPGTDISQIVNCIRQSYYEKGTQLVEIDYAQLIYSAAYKGQRTYELTNISGMLRALALELNIVIIAFAQLKQEVMQRTDKRGNMYDIKDSATFTQDAPIVQILHRPGYFKITLDENDEPYPDGHADVFVAKGRESGTGLCEARFSPVLGFFPVPQEDFIPKDRSNGYSKHAVHSITNTFTSNRKEPDEDMPF